MPCLYGYRVSRGSATAGDEALWGVVHDGQAVTESAPTVEVVVVGVRPFLAGQPCVRAAHRRIGNLPAVALRVLVDRREHPSPYIRNAVDGAEGWHAAERAEGRPAIEIAGRNGRRGARGLVHADGVPGQHAKSQSCANGEVRMLLDGGDTILRVPIGSASVVLLRVFVHLSVPDAAIGPDVFHYGGHGSPCWILKDGPSLALAVEIGVLAAVVVHAVGPPARTEGRRRDHNGLSVLRNHVDAERDAGRRQVVRLRAEQRPALDAIRQAGRRAGRSGPSLGRVGNVGRWHDRHRRRQHVSGRWQYSGRRRYHWLGLGWWRGEQPTRAGQGRQQATGRRAYHWGRRAYHWGRRAYHWGRRAYHWGRRAYHWGRRRGNQ